MGFLKKKGHVRRNWLDRWFVLTTEGVYYYKNRAVREGGREGGRERDRSKKGKRGGGKRVRKRYQEKR